MMQGACPEGIPHCMSSRTFSGCNPQAKTVQEMGTIQQSYLKSQAEQLQSQMKDLGTTAANTAKAATPSTSRG